MIIPIGHEESEVRRWPWVSFAIMAICLLALLATNGDANDPKWEEGVHTLEDAAAYWRERPYLDASPEVEAEVGYDVAPNQRTQYLALMKDQAQDFAPDDLDERAAEQAELDELTRAAGTGGGGVLPAEHPYKRWGFTPADPGPVTLVTHMFMHAGWVHLLSNLFLFFLAGPAIEDRWGRPLFAAFFAASGVASGLFFALMTRDGSLPLVGASGAIAGVLGAFLVRFLRTQIRFAYFFLFGFRVIRGTFEAPAWAMLPLWFGNELFSAWLMDAVGASDGVAYWAHVGGFLFGAGAALAVQRSQLEERFIHSSIEAKVTLARGNPVVEEAARLRAAGDVEGAFAVLEAESRKHPDDPDVGVAFWDAAVALQRPDAAAPALGRAIRRLSAGESLPTALGYWTELKGLVPGALVDPASLLRFVPALRKEARSAEASRALRDAVDPGNRGLTPPQALRVADLARESDPAVALAAARHALESPELPAQTRARLEQQLGGLEGAAASAPPPPPQPKVERAPAPVAAAPADRSIALEFDPALETASAQPTDLAGAALDARWSDVKVAEAVPTALDENALALELAGGRAGRLELAKIQALAVGSVAGLAAKPVILIDLLLNHSELGEGPLRLVRLRSDRFDPRRLAPGATPLEAFRAFLHTLAERAPAALLPDPESFRGGAFAKFADLAGWQRDVLKVG
jgi:membrane associated rhomboid family serine protease